MSTSRKIVLMCHVCELNKNLWQSSTHVSHVMLTKAKHKSQGEDKNQPRVRLVIESTYCGSLTGRADKGTTSRTMTVVTGSINMVQDTWRRSFLLYVSKVHKYLLRNLIYELDSCTR